jgi:hypothetical protein
MADTMDSGAAREADFATPLPEKIQKNHAHSDK